MREAEILARLESLERQNRRLRAGAAFAAILAAGTLLLGTAAGAGEDLEARSVVLRAKEGGPVLRLGAGSDDRFGVFLEAPGGRVRLFAELDGDGLPSLALCDGRDRPRVHARVVSDDLAGLFLNDGGKRNFRTWWVTTSAGPFFDMFDLSGKTRLGLSVLDEAGSAGLSLFNRDGAVRGGFVQEKDDGVRLTLKQGPKDDGKEVVALHARPGGSASIQLSRADESISAAFGILPDGSAGFNVLEKGRKPRVCLTASEEVSILTLCDREGGVRAVLHAIEESAVPPGERGGAPLTSLVILDGKGGVEGTFPAGK